MRIAGLLMLIGGLTCCTVARIQLGSSWSIRPYATRLVTHGIYRKIKHPMYFFAGVWIWGLMMLLNQPLWGQGAVVVLYTCIQYKRTRLEERVLSAEFGGRYWSWRDQTWL